IIFRAISQLYGFFGCWIYFHTHQGRKQEKSGQIPVQYLSVIRRDGYFLNVVCHVDKALGHHA
ncbi:hypothetical protein ACV35V_37565, partial [Pseudomonas aeruginosa]